MKDLISGGCEQYLSPAFFAERHLDLFCLRPRNQLQPALKSLKLQELVTLFITELKLVPSEEWHADRVKSISDRLSQGETWQSVTHERNDGDGPRDPARAYLRWALYGGRRGPTLHDIMVYLGRDATLARLSSANLEAKAINVAET